MIVIRHLNSKLLCLFVMILGHSLLMSQDIQLINPSFEDFPHKGGSDAWGRKTTVKSWYDCALINGFRNETPPDIHSGDLTDDAFWENNLPSADGRTYLGMVVRDNETWEALSQQLALPLRKGKCYSFSIYLARSNNYWSKRSQQDLRESNFIQPAVFQLWGGTGICGDKELLANSDPIDNIDWEKHTFFIEPQSDIYYVTIQAFYKTPVLMPYNGHILLDGASKFAIVECGEEEYAVYTKEKIERPKVRMKMPAHKARAKARDIYKRETREDQVDTVVYVRPKKDKILEELDRSTIRRGQTIKIDQLYFEADTTNINVDSYAVLNEVYDFLNDNPDIAVEIGGHTNGIPPHDYCDKLSTARAEAVAKYLIQKGIEDERIQFKGYGKRKPIASNNSEEGRKRNQRVEIKIISMDS